MTEDQATYAGRPSGLWAAIAAAAALCLMLASNLVDQQLHIGAQA